MEEIDIFSNHFYPLNNSILNFDIAAVESANRTYLAGELAWTGVGGDSLSSFYNTIMDRVGWQNASSPVVVGSMFWSLFGHDVPDCSVSHCFSKNFKAASLQMFRATWKSRANRTEIREP